MTEYQKYLEHILKIIHGKTVPIKVKIGIASHFEHMDNFWKLNFLNFALTSHWTEVSSHCRSVGSINDLGGLCLLLFSLLSFLLPLLFLGSLLLQKFLTNKLQVGDSLFPFHGHLQIFKLILDKRNQIWTHYSISHYSTGNSLIF